VVAFWSHMLWLLVRYEQIMEYKMLVGGKNITAATSYKEVAVICNL
jgi:hypothetical protein